MAYKKPNEMVELIIKEQLLKDACMTVIDGRNEYGFHAIEVPQNCVTQKGNDYHIEVLDKEKRRICKDITVEPYGKDFTFWLLRFHRDTYDLVCLFHNPTEKNPVALKQSEYLAIMAIFCDRFKIGTKTKLLGILKNGFDILKKETGLETSCELLRDFMASETDIRWAEQFPDKYGVRFHFHFDN